MGNKSFVKDIGIIQSLRLDWNHYSGQSHRNVYQGLEASQPLSQLELKFLEGLVKISKFIQLYVSSNSAQRWYNSNLAQIPFSHILKLKSEFHPNCICVSSWESLLKIYFFLYDAVTDKRELLNLAYRRVFLIENGWVSPVS